MYDNTLKDFPRLETDKSDSERIGRAIDATPNGILCIPKGDYFLAEPILIENRCSLDMHPAARLIATEEMDFVITYSAKGNYHALSVFNDDGSVYDNLGIFVKGGDIDGNGLASCFAITNAHHFTMSNITFHNGKKFGLCVGGEKGGHIYELVCNNVYCKCTMKGLTGNVGIFTDRCDSHFTDCFVVDYTVSMRLVGGSNRVTRCHVWGGTIPPEEYTLKEWSEMYAERKRKAFSGGVYTANDVDYTKESDTPEMLKNSISFDIQGGFNVLDGCYADTAEIGYNIGGYTRLIGCDFFNNKMMGIKKSTVINHYGGLLDVSLCSFRSTVGTEVLYTGNKDNVRWTDNTVFGFSENIFDNK